SSPTSRSTRNTLARARNRPWSTSASTISTLCSANWKRPGCASIPSATTPPTANSRGSGTPKAIASSSGSHRRRSDGQAEPKTLAAGLCKTRKTRWVTEDKPPGPPCLMPSTGCLMIVRHPVGPNSRTSTHRQVPANAPPHPTRTLPRANQLQVVRLIGNRAMAKGAHNLPLLQKEHARHLLRIFLDHANPILEKRTLEPAHQDCRMQRVQIRIRARQTKGGNLVERR